MIINQSNYNLEKDIQLFELYVILDNLNLTI